MVYAAVGNCTYQFSGQERAFMANPAKILGPFLMISPVVWLLLGVVFTLAANYFSAFPKDSKRVKGLILFMLALNILKGVQAIGLPWRKFIVNYGDYSKIVTLTYVERTNVLVSTLASAAAQVYLIHRCYKLSGLNETSKKSGYVFLGLVISTWVLEVASAIWVTFYLPTNFVNTRDVAAVGRLPPASHLATDLLITGFTFYYLISSRTGFRSTENMIKRLQVILIQSAAPPAAVCIIWMIVAGLPQPGLQALAHSALPGLDAISVLYSLNSRAEFKYDSSTNPSMKSGAHDTAIQLQDRSRNVGVTVSVNRYVEQSPAPAAQVVNMNRNSLDSDDYKKI